MGTGSDIKNDFYYYNAVVNLWTTQPVGPGPAYSRAGFSLNNEVVFVGGMKDTANCEVWAFNVMSETWTQKPDFPVNQFGGIALTINNNVYAGLGKISANAGNNQLWKSNGTLTSWTL
jgi:N-acetylneuraminic acid mutarotase